MIDEYFTLAIGGMVTLYNNSKESLFPGDMIEWTFYSENNTDGGRAAKRAKMGPRRIGVAVAAPTSERIIGRCLGFAKTGERPHTPHRPTDAPRPRATLTCGSRLCR